MVESADLAPRLVAEQPRRVTALRRGIVRHPAASLAGLALLAIVIAAAFASHLVTDPNAQDLLNRLQPPGTVDAAGTRHVLGTDQFGRDVLARLVHGARVPLLVGIGSALLSGVIGLVIGLVAGYFRGRIDAVLSMLIDIQLSIPFVLIALMAIALFGPGALKIVLVFALTGWAVVARVARGAALTFRRAPFVEVAMLEGASHARILRRHILPNAIPPVVVISSVQAAQFVIYESAFAFFGLGVPPPTASWGNMLAEARDYLHEAWWLVVLPGFCIMALALALNTLGDSLRDAIDPRLRGVSESSS